MVVLLELRLRAVTPVAVRADRSGRRSGMSSTVPGRTVWGGLCAAHTALGRPTPERERWFMGGGIVVSPWHATKAEAVTNWTPAPLTARRCKRVDGHGVWDTLALECSGQFRSVCRDDGCGQQTEPVDDVLVATASGWQVSAPSSGMITKTAIDRARGTVREGMLFSRQVWPPGTTFLGELAVSEADEPMVRAFIAAACEERLLRVGHSRTRGMGAVELVALESRPTDLPETVQERVERFTNKARGHGAPGSLSGLLVPLTLTSDAVVPTGEAPVDPLRWGQPGQVTKVLQLKLRRSQPATVAGYNSLTGLPLADRLGLSAGSVYVYHLDQPVSGLWDALAQLQVTGVGSDRPQGYGSVRVAAAWHTENGL